MGRKEIPNTSEFRYTYKDYLNVIQLYKGLNGEIKKANKEIDRLSKKEIIKSTLGDVIELMSAIQYLDQLQDLTHNCEEYMKKYNECIADSIMRDMDSSRTLN